MIFQEPVYLVLRMCSHDDSAKVLRRCSHDGSKLNCVAVVKGSLLFDDDNSVLDEFHPGRTCVSPSTLFYWHPLRSAACSPGVASGTSSSPTHPASEALNLEWLKAVINNALPVAYDCIMFATLMQHMPMTPGHAVMGALMPWKCTVVAHAAWWAFADGHAAQQAWR